MQTVNHIETCAGKEEMHAYFSGAYTDLRDMK